MAIDTSHLDSGSDKPKDARADLLAAVIEANRLGPLVDVLASLLQSISDNELQISDAAGRTVAKVASDGILQLLGVSARTIATPRIDADRLGLTSGPYWLVTADSVLSVTDDVGREILRLDAAGVATLVQIAVKRLAVSESFSASAVRAALLGLGDSSGPSWSIGDDVESIVDDVGRVVRRVDSTGLHRVVALSAKRLTADESVTFEAAYVRKPLFRTAADRHSIAPMADIVHIVYYGQSWSLGFDAYPATTLTQLYDTLMFNAVPGVAATGVCQQYSVATNSGALQSFTPAVEAGGTGKSPEFPSAYLGETGAVVMCNQVKAMVAFENNLLYTDHACQLLVSAPGEGSKQIEDLADNGQPYILRVKEQIARGYAIAQAAGKTYICGAVTWLQGGSTTSPSTYAAQLEAMRADIDTYAKSVTGQSQDVKLITWQQYPFSNSVSDQSSAKGVYDRFVGAADTYPHIICAGPGYQWPQQSASNIHYTAGGMIGLGLAFGQAIKRTLLDGVKFQPLRPLSIRRQGKVVTLRLNVTVGRIVQDTTQVVAIANLGFNLYSSTGTLLTLSTAAITGPDTIRLTAASSVPSGAFLAYADTGTDATDANKWRGNVRDDSGDFGGVHRWLVAFLLPLDN